MKGLEVVSSVKGLGVVVVGRGGFARVVVHVLGGV